MRLREVGEVAAGVLFTPVALVILACIVLQVMLVEDAGREWRHDMEGKEEV